MTIQEASKRFHIKLDTLQLYLENGLLTGVKMADGTLNYKEDELQRIVQYHFLLKSGMDMETLKRLAHLMESKMDTTAEQVKLLRKCRYQLLEEIHGKQQDLDQLDYMIHEIRQKPTKKEA